MKYKLSDKTKIVMGVTLFKIVALVDIDVYGVKAGDDGGWIENVENLDQYGNAWVSGDAQVSGNAQVSGDAQVSGNAWVSGNARVSGNAQVFGDAQVSGDARVCGVTTKTPILISGLRWHVTIINEAMSIGCQFHKIQKWDEFSEAEIYEMDSKALEFWRENKHAIMTLAKNHMAKTGE